MKVTQSMGIAYAGIAFVLYVNRYGFPSHYGWLDWAALAGFALLVLWLTSPGSDALVDSDGHEVAGDGFAFRLGKSLKRVWRGGRRL